MTDILRRLKEEAVKWNMVKNKAREARLVGIEKQLESLFYVSLVTFPSDSLRMEARSLKTKRQNILEKLELEWRLKIQAL